MCLAREGRSDIFLYTSMESEGSGCGLDGEPGVEGKGGRGKDSGVTFLSS